MRIAYFTNSLNSFVKLDIDILGQIASVNVHVSGIRSKIDLPLSLASQFIFIIKNIFSTDLYFCQFAGYTSLLPSIISTFTGKKCIIVVGGTDTAKFQTLSYGNFSKRLYGLVTKWSYRLASAIITPHAHLIEADYTYCDLGRPKQGINVHYPGFHKPVFVIPNVVDTEYWVHDPIVKREGILTVALGIESEKTRILKGIDLLIEVAKLRSDLKITVTGYSTFPDSIELPPNVTFLPTSDRDVLKGLYQKHQFYAQLSVSEGWGVALCEAMSCGCIPIVSRVGAMPYIISESGYILENRNIQQLMALLEGIKTEELSLKSEKAIQRIHSSFNLQVRSQLLKEAVQSIFNL